MKRTVCLCVPRFAVAALRRAEPELRGAPLVLARSGRASAADGLVVDFSEEAERRGVRRGMTLAQALAAGGPGGADVLVRPLDAAAQGSARRALLEVARSMAPRVEWAPPAEDGTQFVFVDGAGLERVFGSMGGVAASLSARAEHVGFSAGVAIADLPETAAIAAEVAARRGGETLLVPAGRDRQWLASLPMQALRPSEEAGALLGELGVRQVGELTRLAREEVATRLGREGLRLHAVACGEGGRRLRPEPEEVEIAEAVQPDWGVDSLEALLFLLRGVLERLLRRLEVRSLAVAGMELYLTTQGGAPVVVDIGVQAPTREAATLLRLLRHALEGKPPPAAVEEAVLKVREGHMRAEQMDLFRPAAPPPEQLGVLLAQLASFCGEGRVGRPVAPAGHRSEAIAMAPFAPPAAPRVEGPQARHPAGLRGAALRAVRPARLLQVEEEGGRPLRVFGSGFSDLVDACSGPWRLDTEWWREPICRRDYFDVELRGGGFLRIFRELRSGLSAGSWFLDGVYD